MNRCARGVLFILAGIVMLVAGCSGGDNTPASDVSTTTSASDDPRWALCYEEGMYAEETRALFGTKPVSMTFTVDGVARTALVYPGRMAKLIPSPLLLAFHGFGGSASGMQSQGKFESVWPDATVVYPQGLNVLKPSTGQWSPGWPDQPDAYNGRDVRFVEVMLDQLARQYKVDAVRRYATGFSNGSTFTSLLYTQRPQLFAAFGSIAGPATFLNQAQTAKPVLYVSGATDPYVYPELATTMLNEFRRANKCGPQTKRWSKNSLYSVYQPQLGGQPLVWYRHSDGHVWISSASQDIVKFFKEH